MKVVDTGGKSKRLLSLDALRGFDMFLLVGFAGIFRALPELNDSPVNNWLANQFVHPEWHGFTVYDLIFPLFIFIMGVAIPLSFARRLTEPGGKKRLFKHVATRAIILILLGATLWGSPWGMHQHYGFYSVLFRIGFSYFFASLIYMKAGVRGQIAWAFGLVIGLWLLMRFFPVPGYGMGDYSQEGNTINYLRTLFAENVSYNFRYVVDISLAPTISIALFGVLAGQLLRSGKSESEKTTRLLVGGFVLILLGLLSHLEFTITKWVSPAFIFLTSGISASLMAIFYWIIDVKGYKKWAFFLVVVGVNSITIYVANFLIDFKRVANVFVGGIDFGNGNALALAIAIAAIKWLFLYYFYKQKIFLKI